MALLRASRIGARRVFLVSGPDLIEQVLVTDAKHYIKHFERGRSGLCLETDLLPARVRFGVDSASSSNPRS